MIFCFSLVGEAEENLWNQFSRNQFWRVQCENPTTYRMYTGFYVTSPKRPRHNDFQKFNMIRSYHVWCAIKNYVTRLARTC